MSESDDSTTGHPLPEEDVETLTVTHLPPSSSSSSSSSSTTTTPSPPPPPAATPSLPKRLLAALDSLREGESDGAWWCVWWMFVVAAVVSRLHYITVPYKVVWDEAHFGKMVGWYMNRTFFMDVHPAGGKLLLTLFGYLGGYNGTHSFVAPNTPYDGYHGIMPMRVGCAILGAGMVPLGFHTVWTLTRSLPASTFAAALITFEVGTITLSKFILLDPPLFFFIMASFHGLCLMHSVADRPFSRAWWGSYLYTGTMLGCVISVKFVGLFVVLVVGWYTALDLWAKLGELHRPLVSVVQHFLARFVCLIILPACIYITVFFIHDTLLDSAVNLFAVEEAHFSPGFQMTLRNSSLNNITQPSEVAYGNVVTLRNDNLAGIYLHSHNFTYPQIRVGKNKQQVTGFRAKDVNNYFKVLLPEEDPEMENGYYAGMPEFLGHGDWVRLYHPTTKTLISCGKNKSLVTKKHQLVYAKPYNLTVQEEGALIKDAFNLETKPTMSSAEVTPWQLWAVHVEGGKPGDVVRTLDSKVKFLCVAHQCALTWSRGTLPMRWGGGQAEVTCSNNLQDPYTNWMVEQNFNPYLKNNTYEHLKSGFVSRFLETHRVMTWVNSRLKPMGQDLYDSHRPWMWPLCFKSQVWFDVNFRIVLLGNPLIFWVNLAFLLVAPGLLVYHHYKMKRGLPHNPKLAERKERMIFAVKWLLLAYSLHYLPFYTMDRILYYHHYFPALQFSSMLTAVVFGYALECLDTWLPRVKANVAFHWASGVFLGILAYSFHLYCYVGYGHPTDGEFNPDNSTFKDIRFFDEWEI
ncbi:protein O-mannosyl-transferase 2-like [Homarus americanus]|uniref:protein O-mannosyl-transferase 2-like n=1 Tax=Homarus americanus TaxID=6706 RepID=UPI001C46081D|nr:protein O-mannosyl-transferase 2-like [Homarus americanus]